MASAPVMTGVADDVAPGGTFGTVMRTHLDAIRNSSDCQADTEYSAGQITKVPDGFARMFAEYVELDNRFEQFKKASGMRHRTSAH